MSLRVLAPSTSSYSKSITYFLRAAILSSSVLRLGRYFPAVYRVLVDKLVDEIGAKLVGRRRFVSRQLATARFFCTIGQYVTRARKPKQFGHARERDKVVAARP